MQVPFYGHYRQYQNLKTEIDKNIKDIIKSGNYVQGPMLKQFEDELAAYYGMKFAIGLNSGTDALWLSFMALGIGPGDECITHPNTFFATAEAIWIAGATAVFVDCDPKTKCIDPRKIEAAITPKTKAIVPVHLYGHTADMKAIKKIAKKHKLYLVEDNAQSIDGSGDGFKQGELSETMCTSFIIQKNLGTFGDGGAVLTNDKDIDKTIRRLRNHGSLERSHHSYGFNSRLDDIHAGVLSAKLKHLREFSENRRKWAALYTKGLKKTQLTLPYEAPGYYHVYHLYVVETENEKKRQSLLDYLVKNGVDAKLHYPIAIHQQKGYPWGKEARIVGDISNSEHNAATCVSLPMFPELKKEEVEYSIAKVVEWDKANRK